MENGVTAAFRIRSLDAVAVGFIPGPHRRTHQHTRLAHFQSHREYGTKAERGETADDRTRRPGAMRCSTARIHVHSEIFPVAALAFLFVLFTLENT